MARVGSVTPTGALTRRSSAHLLFKFCSLLLCRLRRDVDLDGRSDGWWQLLTRPGPLPLTGMALSVAVAVDATRCGSLLEIVAETGEARAVTQLADLVNARPARTDWPPSATSSGRSPGRP